MRLLSNGMVTQMNEKFAALFQPVRLGNGVISSNRFAMAPMVIWGSHDDGSLSQADFDYITLRNDTGGLEISGAAAISREGWGWIGQMAIFDDAKIPGFKKYAEIMKSKGNKAIMQLHHAGREAVGGFHTFGKVQAPSAMKFPWLDYVPEALTHEQILGIINDFGEATRRAIEAGFDGVEVHGANHYLLQQFFSPYSNTRDDEWGGSLENRMRFPLAVLKKVKEVATEKAGKDFIVGYRISPEEIHGENVYYTVDDALHLIEKVVEGGADYVHLSTGDYKGMPKAGGNNEPVTTTVKKHIAGRVPMLVAGGILTPELALDALNYTDVAAIGRAVLIDPDFVPKLENGAENTIELSVKGRLPELALPQGILDLFQMENSILPPLNGL